MPGIESDRIPTATLIDAGVFIGSLLKGDPRHAEARPLVEHARQGILDACTTSGILSEVYGALTWEKAQPRHDPGEAAEALRLLVDPSSAIGVYNLSPFPHLSLQTSQSFGNLVDKNDRID